MIKRNLIRVAICLLFLTAVQPLLAEPKAETVTIKLASLVPENTPWGEFLNRVAAEWDKATGGAVKMIVYHSGIAGTEDDIIRKLNMNQVQAAMLSSLGLTQLDPAMLTLNCPFLIRTEEELDRVLASEKEDLNRRIRAKGYFPLAWSKVGWIRFFSKEPVRVPADLKAMKVGTDENFPKLTDAFKAMGYKMVPIQMNQVLIALSGGQIDATYQAPAASAGLQLFGVAKNMATIPVAPFLGCIVMTNTAWNSIPERFRPELLRITAKLEAELDAPVQQLEDSIIKTMQEYGLVINEVPPEAEKLWYADFQGVINKLIGTTFDKTLYDRIDAILSNYRAGQ
jgi:TRAP-type C4-dicarboxylate transport system substrate-binding protein